MQNFPIIISLLNQYKISLRTWCGGCNTTNRHDLNSFCLQFRHTQVMINSQECNRAWYLRVSVLNGASNLHKTRASSKWICSYITLAAVTTTNVPPPSQNECNSIIVVSHTILNLIKFYKKKLPFTTESASLLCARGTRQRPFCIR